ncbi:axial regulator YABBY 1-like isoform X2 [Punica granatum]|uniref:Axial regulator YABBY 1-like isoform X2 n=2 Tax=Punica granatum TaxID=22663 RepID=A0A218X665_PUNGR|nr:axial regulator YABBY 1-like isoform X2 [Punica granatum]OWM80186.1 hypothetical protein CDL15_Pgr019350 [Punica granatum]
MMSSSSSSSSSSLSPDHLSPTDQLRYVHCNFCDTVLAVSVPCSSLFKTVTVRCGHCANLLSVNMRGLLLPSPAATAATQLQQLGHTFFAPHNLLEEIRNVPPTVLMNHHFPNPAESVLQLHGGSEPIPRPALVNRPPEKRQRVPSAYNRFIKEEIQRIKAQNPDISHREAFSAAAKNWAHFPHIHFGLMPEQSVKKPTMCQQEGEDMLRKDGLFAPANLGVSPY